MIHAWNRYWTKPDGQISFADQGFLVGPEEADGLGFGSSDLWSFDQIADRGCLVLLGEPGMGKTQTLRAEAEAVSVGSSESRDLVLQVDLGATRDERVLERQIFESQQFQTWLGGGEDLHLFLDSLDEAVLRLGVVGDIILRGIADVDTSRLRLRLACRTADRLPDFESKLLAQWPEEHAGIYELAPLRRADVRIAAQDRGQDPREFIEQVVQRDAVAFAIKPVTLGMLLDLAEDDVGLPHSQVDLYEMGLPHLVAERGERRHRDPQTRGSLSTGQRLTVASRIAGSTILSGRTAIAAAATAQPTGDAVTAAELAGGSEIDRTIAVPTTFEVSEADVREALGTGLFSAHGDDLGWAHQTYGEYLAARYLTTAAGMSSRQAMTLLISDADEGRVVPQLRDVAAWTAAMSPALMERLAEQDPLVLLRGEIALADDEQKARLAGAILQERVVKELDRWDPRVRRNLEALKHEGLEAILRQHLDPQQPQVVQELACELAEICRLSSLQEDLLGLALSNEPVRVRADAVNALRVVGNRSTLRQLRPLALDALPEDTDDELKGTTLRAICPTVATGAEVLPHLTPQKQRHVLGAYAMFLSHDLPQLLTVDELPAALEWARRVAHGHDAMDEFGYLAEQILVRAADAMESDAVLIALAETVAEYLQNHYHLQSSRTRHMSDALTAEANRYRLLVALVPLIRDERLDAVNVLMATPRLIAASDLPWFVEQLGYSIGEDTEAVWAELIDWTAGFQGADHELLMAARETSQLLYERTRARYGPVDVNSELAAQMRVNYARQKKWEEEERQFATDPPDFDANIDFLLDRFEAGDLDSFWRLNVDIWGKEGETHVAVGGSDLTQSAGWQRATAARRGRIAAAADVYARRYQPSDEWLLDVSHGYLPAAAGYRAIRYLTEHAPEVFATLDSATLCGWTSALLASGIYSDDSEFDGWILRLFEQRCIAALVSASQSRVSAEAAHGEGDLFVLHRLHPVLGGELGVGLLQLWRTEELAPRPQAQLIKALLQAGVDGAAESAVAALTSESVAVDPERSRELAVALLNSGDSSAWSHIWPLITENADWGSAVFEAHAHSRDNGGDVRTELGEVELAELFVWLSTRFPADEDPSRAGAHVVAPRESVANYRDQIIGTLVQRGTSGSLQAFSHIESSTGLDLSYARIRAEETWRRNSWVPPRPADVIQLAADVRRRVVLSEADLQHVIIEGLEQIQDLLAHRGEAQQVWDTAARRPKRETEVAAWIASRLRELVRGRGIVVNREVEVRVNPRGGVGDSTDIHVDALAGERVEGAEQMTVVAEVKCCWHRELRTAMRSQLVDKYLSPSQRHGIYLAVLFGPERWGDQGDARREACDRVDREDLIIELTQQADDIRTEGFEITPVILDASLS